MPNAMLSQLYPAHLAQLKQRSDMALATGGFDHLVIPSGSLHYQAFDDRTYPYQVNPHFKAWLPITRAPYSWLIYTPGKKPQLIYFQPYDYWHVVPETPAGYWVDYFDITLIRTPHDAIAYLPQPVDRCAIMGGKESALDSYLPNNPQAVMNYLHYHRAWKTDYELVMMRVASKLGARAHHAAEQAFRRGESEYGIHMAYLAAVHQTEQELPYDNIIALNSHGAVLHYTDFQRVPPAYFHSLLIDAGAGFHGYACDITRTYAATGHAEFQELIDAVESAQLSFVDKVRKGQSYPELHLHSHHVLSTILHEQNFIRMSAESAIETGVSRVFFPHGLGHYIGLQVHDVGAFQKDETGDLIPKSEHHPYLRLTRTIEPRQVMTIEPGIYFIEMLLEKLKAGVHSQDINWKKVDEFRKFGGIRIEDDVVCTEASPENLTRDAFAEVRGT